MSYDVQHSKNQQKNRKENVKIILSSSRSELVEYELLKIEIIHNQLDASPPSGLRASILLLATNVAYEWFVRGTTNI